MAKSRTSRTPSTPVPPNTPQGLSLRELYDQTPPLYRNGAADVSVRSIKKTASRGGFPAITSKTITPTSRTPTLYDTWIVGKEKDKAICEQSAVIVQCSCPNYMYVWEYANAVAKAAKVIYGNGDPPLHTNPGLHTALCRHLCALADVIFKRKL